MIMMLYWQDRSVVVSERRRRALVDFLVEFLCTCDRNGSLCE
jgi:hypothetical protein